MSKNGDGEGSIRQRPDGRFEARLRVGDGKRRGYYGKSRKEVRVKLEAVRRDHEAGRLSKDPKKEVGPYLDEWLTQSAARRVKPTTLDSYRLNVTRLQKHLGAVRMDKLRHTHIQAAYDALRDDGLAERTVQQVHGVLRMALRQAVKWGYIPYCPTDLVETPRPPHKEMRPLTADEARALLEASKAERLYALWAVLIATGLRMGEATALAWDDVDLQKRTVRVRRTLHRQVGKGMLFGEPKTTRSRRTVKLPAVAVAALRTHRMGQVEERLLAGSEWRDQGLIFATVTGGPLDGGYLNQALHRSLAAAGLPRVRIHDLRHTAATLMLERGASIKAVQNALGHSTAMQTMNTYAHLTTDMQDEAVLAMDALFSTTKEAV